MSVLNPRPGIMDINPYVGGESVIPGVSRVIKLASNEGALGPSPNAMEAYAAAAQELHRYPDGDCATLRAVLAGRYGLDKSRIVCGAGSDELLGLLCRAYAGPGDEVLYPQYGFLMYPIAAKSAGATPVVAPEKNLTADVDALLAKVTPRTRIVFIANPNNPTGSYLSIEEMRRLQAGLPKNVLLVIDAAYAEFVTRNDYSSGQDLVETSGNVVMTRTFSKIYALGGVRLGWAYCPAEVADVLNRVRNPFNVSSPAQAAGLAALADEAFMQLNRAHNDVWLPWLSDKLHGMGIAALPSVGNFVLARFPKDPAKNADAADAFLKSHGIILRKVAGYGLPDCLRITIGRDDEMKALVDALKDFMG